MKKFTVKMCVMLIILAFSCVSLIAQTTAEVPPNYADEDAGSIENPYQISNLANLRWLSETEEFYATTPQQQTFTYFAQTADIDASETATWNNGRGFMPIGRSLIGGLAIPEDPTPTTDRSFFGNYNGNNYTISGLHITYHQTAGHENLVYYGLFGIAAGSEFINIHLTDINYDIHILSTPFIYVGSLLGLGGNNISNCSATGNMSLVGELLYQADSIGMIGGLVGFGLGNIRSCSSKVNITDNITYSEPVYSIYTMHGGTGGLVGLMSGGSISNSFYYGNIVRNSPFSIQQGGLAGFTWPGTLENCYVASESPFINAKGAFGQVMVEHEASYYPEDPPIIIAAPTVRNSFWDVSSTGATDPYYYLGTIWPYISLSDVIALGVSGLPTQQMKQADTYITAGWNMQEIWGIDPAVNGGYPYLRSQTLPPTQTSPTNLTAFKDGGQVVLSWQAPSESVAGEIFGFRVTRNNALLATVVDHAFIDNTLVEGVVYKYGVSAVYADGVSQPAYVSPDPVSEIDMTTLFAKVRLVGNYPNPFNPITTIKFDVVAAGLVTIDVFNVKGQKVRSLVNGVYGLGEHNVVWNGLSDNGENVGSGVYFYRMQADGVTETKKMVMMK